MHEFTIFDFVTMLTILSQKKKNEKTKKQLRWVLSRVDMWQAVKCLKRAFFS